MIKSSSDQLKAVGCHPPTEAREEVFDFDFDFVFVFFFTEKHCKDDLISYSLPYLGKPRWLFVIVVLEFHFLRFDHIDSGLGFVLLIQATKALQLPLSESHLA